MLILPLILAVTLHEVAHGYAALKMGDHTARLAGRLTLNPIKHLDLFGSFLLPLVLKLSGSPIIFGYAKPVPVNYHNFREYRKGTLWVASAGVLANAILVVMSAALFQLLAATMASWTQSQFGLLFVFLFRLLEYSVIINCILALFNLIPIPPLDGSRVLAGLVPGNYATRIDAWGSYGFFILIILLYSGLLRYLWMPMAWLIKLLIGV